MRRLDHIRAALEARASLPASAAPAISRVSRARPSVAEAIERAELSFRFDGDARWSGLEHNETLRVDGLGGLPGFTSTSRLELTSASDPAPLAVLGRDAGHEPEYESAFAATAPQAALGSARLSGLSWSEALARLHSFATEAQPDEAQQKRAGRAYLALTEHLRQDPERAAIAERAVLEGGPLVQTWIEALRDADTEQSHAAEALEADPRMGRQAVFDAVVQVAEHDPSSALRAAARGALGSP